MKAVIMLIVVTLILAASSNATGPPAPTKSKMENATLIFGGQKTTETDTAIGGTVLRMRTDSQIPILDCNDGIDGDDPEDTLVDLGDPGCTYYGDDDETNAPIPPPPPPPPPPPDWPLLFSRQTATEYNECENGEVIGPKAPCLSPDTIRCKRKTFEWVFKQGNPLEPFDVGVYFGEFRVCYRPYGNGITSITYRRGWGTWDGYFWHWLNEDGNANGYPYHIREPHIVRFYYRMGMHLCVHEPVCGPDKWGWETWTFKDTGLYGNVTFLHS